MDDTRRDFFGVIAAPLLRTLVPLTPVASVFTTGGGLEFTAPQSYTATLSLGPEHQMPMQWDTEGNYRLGPSVFTALKAVGLKL